MTQIREHREKVGRVPTSDAVSLTADRRAVPYPPSAVGGLLVRRGGASPRSRATLGKETTAMACRNGARRMVPRLSWPPMRCRVSVMGVQFA